MLLDLPGKAFHGEDDRDSVASAPEISPGVQPAADADPETPAGPGDALLYPTSADGLVHVGALALALWLAELSRILTASFLRVYSGILVLVLKIFIAGYIVFYLSYCVFDSSRGGKRAPCMALAPTPNREELLSEALLLLAGTAISLWPAAIYYGVTLRVDTWSVLLAISCGFLWPMSLLAAVLFGGIDALNPVLIVRSILVTLPAYLVLTLELAVLAILAAGVSFISAQLPVPRVFCNAAYLYLLLIGTHLLGRHYRRHRDRLDWGL
jgi:hypothetical protein